jgi:hypothetical protein
MFEDQLIILFILGLCIILCFESRDHTFCVIIMGIILTYLLYKHFSHRDNMISLKSTNQKKQNFIPSPYRYSNKYNSKEKLVTLPDKILLEPMSKPNEELITPQINLNIPNTYYQGSINIKDNCDGDNNNCLDNAFLDGDERISYSNVHRNEPTRVINGLLKTYQHIDRYIHEELDDQEKNWEWWGLNEY